MEYSLVRGSIRDYGYDGINIYCGGGERKGFNCFLELTFKVNYSPKNLIMLGLKQIPGIVPLPSQKRGVFLSSYIKIYRFYADIIIRRGLFPAISSSNRDTRVILCCTGLITTLRPI
jgi:hypothetical protein